MNEMQLTPQQLAETLRAGVRDEQALRRTGPFLAQIDVHLGEHISPARKDVGISEPRDNIQFIDRSYYYLAPNQTSAHPVLSVYIVPNRIWWGVSAWGSEDEMAKLAGDLQRLGIVREGEEIVVQKGSFTPAWKGGSLLLLGNELSAELLERQSDIMPVVEKIGEDLVDFFERLIPHLDELSVQPDEEPQNRAWLFQANPQFFDLAQATDVRKIQVGSNDSWAVMRYGAEMQSGDSVVLWQSGAKSGIYALGYLTSSPYIKEVQATEEQIKQRPYLAAGKWIDLQYTHILDRPVLRNEVKDHPILSGMQVMQFPRSTNFRLAPEEWKAIEELVQERSARTVPPRLKSTHAFFESIFPDKDTRDRCLTIFTDAIEEAHALGESCWAITRPKEKNRINLNVGVHSVFTLGSEVGIRQDLDLVSDEIEAELESIVKWGRGGRKAIPSSGWATVDTKDLPSVWSQLHPIFSAHLQQSYRVRSISPFQESHVTEVLDYLRWFLDRDIPNPGYVGKELSGIEAFVASLFPDIENRRTCLEYFADCIEHAHKQAPVNWGVTVLDDRIRLNVGSVVTFTLVKQKIWLAVDELSQVQRTQLSWRTTLTPEHDYNSMEPVTTLYVPQEHVAEVRVVLQDKHSTFLNRAATTKMHRPSKDAHSEEFIQYLRRFLKRNIPQPAYVTQRGIFKIAPGPDAKYWSDCLENNYICVGWDEAGDLQKYETRDTFEASFRELFWNIYNGNTRTIQQKAEEVWTLRELEPGDIVIANQGKSKVLAIGTVVDPGYEWNPQRPEYQHGVHVDWDTSYAQDIPTQSRWGFHTVLPVSEELYQRIVSRGPFVENVDVVESFTGWLRGNGFYFTPWQIGTFFTALQTKGFVILSGISGTGKSKLAQYFAQAMPQPRFSAPAEYDDVISITVQPYMLKYNRFIIPKSTLPLYEAPPAGEGKDVVVRHGANENHCRLTHETSGVNYIVLYLRGSVTQWFKNTFAEGDTMIVEPLWISEGEFQGFHLQTEENYQLKKRVTTEEGQNWHFTSVRPDWRDSKSLLGYYNPLSGSYEWTPFLRFLLRVVRSYKRYEGVPWFVILDEMNLAHVEYYFADLLSVLESGRDEEGWTREPVQLVYPEEATGDLPPREIHLPPNLYIVGTVNVDETTHAFSPKVQDRAFTLELTEADFSHYPPDDAVNGDALPLPAITRQALLDVFDDGGQFVRIDKKRIASYVAEHPQVRHRLRTLNKRLRPFGFHFGYRVFDEIVTFLAHAEENEVYDQVLEHVSDDVYTGLDSLDLAFDAAILMKVLPKFHGTRGQLEKPLRQILAWCVDPDETNNSVVTVEETAEPVLQYRFPHTANRLQRMLQMLYATGFAT